MPRIHPRTLEALLFASLMIAAMAGCAPEPGTPEFVLEKLKAGNVVGGENLGLLGPDRIPDLNALLEDPGAPRIARMQALERLIQLHGPDGADALAPFLDDPDPEVRMRIAYLLAERHTADSLVLLLGRFEREGEALVRQTLARSLQNVARSLEKPPDGSVERLAACLAKDDGPRRIDAVLALGGFHGEAAERVLIEALDDRSPALAGAAARSLRGPAVRSIDRMGPIYVSLLASPNPEIRQMGLTALESATHPNRVPGPTGCQEKPVLRLVEAVPEVDQAVEALLGRADLSERERSLATALRECVAKFAPSVADGGP